MALVERSKFQGGWRWIGVIAEIAAEQVAPVIETRQSGEDFDNYADQNSWTRQTQTLESLFWTANWADTSQDNATLQSAAVVLIRLVG